MKIAIIGAGIGGLASACLLAAKGHRVEVFEQNNEVGGKLNQVFAKGFRFDTGPSLLTMPFVLKKLFDECGFDMEKYLTLKPLSPICRYNYSDGTVFDCFDNRIHTMHEIEQIAPEDVEAYSKFLDHANSIYDKTADAFIFNPLYDVTDFKKLNLFSFFGIDAFSTVSSSIDSRFKSKYLRQFFKRFATYNGSSPFLAPATLNVIPHVELNQGGFYLEGGLYRLAETLFTMATTLRVRFHFGAKVEKITSSSHRAKEIIANGTIYPADLVVSNSDATETNIKLLDSTIIPQNKKRKLAGIEPSTSGFVLLLGIDKKYEQLVHHNIFFSEDYEYEFHQLFHQKVMPDDPTIYIADTSYSDPEHAPDGGSNLFVLVNAPYLNPFFDWSEQAGFYAQKVVQILEDKGLTNLSSHIKFSQIITPEDFYGRYTSNKGSIYGTSSNDKFSAFNRPRNKSKLLEGLYLVGGSTHPGGGIPLVIQSAFNAVNLIDRYELK